MACTLDIAGSGAIGNLLRATDCVIAAQVERGYGSLTAPGSVVATSLTALLTIYVAVIGYRLILGRMTLSPIELIPHFIKIGVVLMLLTNWPSYQMLVFDMVFRAPEQLADAVVRGALPGTISGGGAQNEIVAALQAVFDRLTEAATALWPQPAGVSPVAGLATPPHAGAAPQMGADQFQSLALWFSAIVLLGTTIGVLLVVKIVLALLLVLGPLFIGTLLFASTRAIFEGWLRTSLRFALVPLFTLPFAAAMVLVLAPFLARLDDIGGVAWQDGPVPVIVLITLVFAAVLLLAGRLAGGIVEGLHLPRPSLAKPSVEVAPLPAAEPVISGRAQEIVETLARTLVGNQPIHNDRRALLTSAGVAPVGGAANPVDAPPQRPDSIARLGQSYRRIAVGAMPHGAGHVRGRV